MKRIISVSFLVSLVAVLVGSSPALAAVRIDVRPGAERNVINPNANGMIPVALLGDADFAVDAVAISSLSLGPQGSSAGAQPEGPSHFADVNNDGYNDVVLKFSIQATGVRAGDTQLCLTGPSIQACDAIVTVPE